MVTVIAECGQAMLVGHVRDRLLPPRPAPQGGATSLVMVMN